MIITNQSNNRFAKILDDNGSILNILRNLQTYLDIINNNNGPNQLFYVFTLKNQKNENY